jgi:hypothetical protein
MAICLYIGIFRVVEEERSIKILSSTTMEVKKPLNSPKLRRIKLKMILRLM